MIYRELGRTGYKVSQLGFGAMRLPMVGEGEEARVDPREGHPDDAPGLRGRASTTSTRPWATATRTASASWARR